MAEFAKMAEINNFSKNFEIDKIASVKDVAEIAVSAKDAENAKFA